jgi:hypothetical protein
MERKLLHAAEIIKKEILNLNLKKNKSKNYQKRN